MHVLLFVVLLILRDAAADNVFRFGAVLSTSGDSGRNMEEAKNGYELYLNSVNDLNSQRGFFLRGKKSSEGFYFKYAFLWRDDEDDELLHAERVTELIYEEEIHFLGGSHSKFAEEEMELANSGGVLNYHCCVSQEAYYETALPVVFGVTASNAGFTRDFISALFLVRNEETAVVYDAEDAFQKSTCEAAVEIFLRSKNPFSASELTYTQPYNKSTTTPEFFKDLAKTAKRRDVHAMIACVDEADGKAIIDALHDEEYSLRSMFLTQGPTKEKWVESLEPKYKSEMLLSATQWHPKVKYTDEFFGSAEGFAYLYERKYGKVPRSDGAAAAAVGLTLTQAIREAFKRCDITATEGDVEKLLYDPDAIECDDDLGRKGYNRVLEALALLEMETFFGNVKFNPYGQNVGKLPLTTQIFEKEGRNGRMHKEIEVVFPISVASDLPKYPAPNFYKQDCAPGFHVGLDDFDPCVPCRKGEVAYTTNSEHCDSCPIGQWMDHEGGSECSPCPYGTVTEVRGATSKMECICRIGFFNAAQQTGVECEMCPVGATCAGGTELPVPSPGFWANETQRTYIYECDPASTCLGGDEIKCAPGYDGRLCAQCADGYFGTIRGCYACFNPVAITLLLIALVGLWYFINVTVSRSVASLEMILGWAQLANIIGDVNLNWTDHVRRTFGVANILDFDVDVLEPSCLFSWGFKENFTTQLLLPFVMSIMGFFGFLGSSVAYFMVKNGWIRTEGKRNCLASLFVLVPEDKEQLQKKWDATIATFLSSVDVTYVTITKYCFDIFKCQNIAGENVLMEDSSVMCGDEGHKKLTAVAIIGIVFYVVGYPLYICWTLFSLRRNQSFSNAVNIRRCGFVYEKFELDYYFTPAIIIVRKFLFVVVLVFMNNPAFQVGTLAVIITASLMIHVYTAPYVDTYLDVLFSFLLIALMFEAFGGLMFYSDNLPHANRRILEWLVIITLIMMAIVFVAILLMEIVQKFHVKLVKKAHRGYLIRGLSGRGRFLLTINSMCFSADSIRKRLQGEEEAVPEVSLELLDTFKPGFVYNCIKKCPQFIEKWDKMTNMLKGFMSDQSETSYLSMDPMAKFWRKLVNNFPELTDFLAVADDETRSKFNDVATNLYQNFYLTNKVSPLPLMKVLNWRDYAPMAQWLAIAPAADREFFLSCVLQMFRITGNAEAADILESKLENGGSDPQLEGRLSEGAYRWNQTRRILDRIQDGSHPFRHSASLPALNTAAARAMGIDKYRAGKSHKSDNTTSTIEEELEKESFGTVPDVSVVDLDAEPSGSLPNNHGSFSSETSMSYKSAKSDIHTDDAV